MIKALTFGVFAACQLLLFGEEPAPPPLLQSQVKGLLVITLPDGSHAGAATQMNATAVKSVRNTGFDLKFNQQVGPLMSGASDEVEKFMKIRHAGNLPAGYIIEFGFADKHTLKDGPSAAVACALMTNAIITGKPLDPDFAATGDMTATGSVRPVGGVAAKIRGALRKKCTIFSVPEANSSSVDDLYITDGLALVCEIQIIAVKTFEESLSVASLEKTPEITAALADFEMVQKAIANNEKNAKHPKVQEKLRSILKAIPGHHSARLVALHGQGRGPKALSLIGSLNAIDQGAGKFGEILENGNIRSTQGLEDPLRDVVFALSRIRKSIDPRTKGILDSYTKIAYFFKARREKKYFNSTDSQELRKLMSNLNAEKNKLRNNREIQEELMAE